MKREVSGFMEVEDDLKEFASMWDGSEEWELQAYRRDEATVFVVFAGGRPTIGEMSAFRHLSEQFRDKPLHEVKSYLQDKSEVRLGRFSGMIAHEIEDRVKREGLPLNLRIEGRSVTDYMPIGYNQSGEVLACIIEDSELEERVIKRMLENGVPVFVMPVEID